jgi:phenylacetate-CoA ligase
MSRLSPLADARAQARTERLLQHAHAPIWRWEAGDRLEREDLEAVRAFGQELARRGERLGGDPEVAPPERVADWVDRMRDRVPLFRERLREGIDVRGDFESIPTSSREDLALRPERMVPDDAPLDQMIVYRTAGTTGHALLVPHHPRAAACYLPLVAAALERWGVRAPDGDDEIGAFNVGAQRRTVTYPCTLSAWGGTGFAKLNLSPSEWRSPRDAAAFFEDLEPRLLTGDPLSFAEMLRLGIPARPRALLTTAVALSSALRERLSDHFGAPVIDWYSLTETGPIAYACPRGEGYHLLPHDLYVEVIDEAGRRSAERGEITVTGGRNPFLPLLRYRTGDFARLVSGSCACGDPAPWLVDLLGRKPVTFRAADGSAVNPVDVAQALREFPLVQHELVQRADRSLELGVRVLSNVDLAAVAGALAGLFGGLRVSVRRDDQLGEGGGKVVPYVSEL